MVRMPGSGLVRLDCLLIQHVRPWFSTCQRLTTTDTHAEWYYHTHTVYTLSCVPDRKESFSRFLRIAAQHVVRGLMHAITVRLKQKVTTL